MTGRLPALLLLAAAFAAAGCNRSKPTSSNAAAQIPAASGPAAEAELLGHQIFELIDGAVDYKGSHRGRAPKSLKQLGVDSLTPETERRLGVGAEGPAVTVSFRQPAGHALRSCSADTRILEESALNGGRFTITCDAGGAPTTYQVGDGAER
jgi:hypothetical protein